MNEISNLLPVSSTQKKLSNEEVMRWFIVILLLLVTDVTHCTSKVNTRVVQNEILLIVTDFGDTPLTPRTRVEPNII
ncbi:hypothetical protein [Candidatus Parabeggiatoa sp. HSG14]|uniref:hypothetical protein n=1 Tax=Candidatus Parabeggiatoa sp. HSG14 TaxID=3055593 RepID=UPI0025A90B3C|nr:hypothetical protein [Thiotrichales bacterium HSG14]